MTPGFRVLFIALLLFGSTESALCQSLCARPSDLQLSANASSAEMAGSAHAGCHGSGEASPEPLSNESDEPCEVGCCTVLTRATTAPVSSPDPASAAFPMPIRVAPSEGRAGRDRLPRPRPSARLESPFHFWNPPLLI
jgi:hypothetical protein